MTTGLVPTTWRCPVCRGGQPSLLYDVPSTGTEGGVAAAAFRPSSDRFGTTVNRIVRCQACGHGSLAESPPPVDVEHAYADAVDAVSLREERGQIETARRALVHLERWVNPGRLCDLGCWTGSLLVAARDRGWQVVGIEPSSWAADHARQRGLDVRTTTLLDHGLEEHAFDAVTLCDVLEHLDDPAAALAVVRELLRPGGVVYLTLPDAGSPLARALGRRWWSILPMHLQYFTRGSIVRLLNDAGFSVLSVDSHAKVFSARYYAERLLGYSQLLGDATVKLTEWLGAAEKLVAPDLHDRMAVVAAAVPEISYPAA
jgi:SAM-dependent methyltransferase